MLKRPLTMAALLAAAAGGPYALHETEIGQSLKGLVGASTKTVQSVSSGGAEAAKSWSNWIGTGTAKPNPNDFSSTLETWNSAVANWNSNPPGFAIPGQESPANHPASTLLNNSISATPVSVGGNTESLWQFNMGTPSLSQIQSTGPIPNVTGGPVHDFRDVLRFDITPAWVPQHFARVSTVLSDLNLDGLRTPLVTGTKITDLAGTLTYYFDRSQRLQRISVHGFCGDASQLTQLLQQYYGMQPEASLGGGLMISRWNGEPTSVLRVAPAPVLYAGQTQTHYTVFLELNQPSLSYGLSQEARDLVKSGQAAQRW